MQLAMHKYVVLLSAILLLSYVLSYIISVVNLHQVSLVPTISDLGKSYPERSILAFGMYLAAALFLCLSISVYCYYDYLFEIMKPVPTILVTSHPNDRKFMNKLMLSCGIISSICLGGFASFDSMNAPNANHVFLGITFLFTWLFMLSGTLLYHSLINYLEGMFTLSDLRLKIFITTISTLCVFGGISTISYCKWYGSNLWGVLALFECCFVFSFAAYCISFWASMKSFRLCIQFQHYSNHAQVQTYLII